MPTMNICMNTHTCRYENSMRTWDHENSMIMPTAVSFVKASQQISSNIFHVFTKSVHICEVTLWILLKRSNIRNEILKCWESWMRKKVIVWNKGSKGQCQLCCDSITGHCAAGAYLGLTASRECRKGNEALHDRSLPYLGWADAFITIHLPQLRKLSILHLWRSFKTVKGIK